MNKMYRKNYPQVISSKKLRDAKKFPCQKLIHKKREESINSLPLT